MKCAREMFEKLGYKYTYDNINYLDYTTNGYNSNSSLVQFEKEDKSFRLINFDKSYFSCSMQLNKAIQQQIKELGWEE